MQPDIPYRSALLESLELNLQWILNSINATSGNGSAAYRWMWGKWGDTYPETTGYLIPTLLNANHHTDVFDIEASAKELIGFLISIQNENGSFPLSVGSNKVNVFDTAQILLGLSNAYERYKDDDILNSIQKCHIWLSDQFNRNGKIPDNNLVEDYNPTYYLRIIWPLMFSGSILNVEVSNSLQMAYSKWAQKISEGRVYDASFVPGDASYSHTVIYAVRGLIECDNFIQDSEIHRADAFLKIATEQILEYGSYPGRIFGDGKMDYSFICTAGHVQLILCLLKRKELLSKEKLHQVISILFSPVYKSQKNRGYNKGAVPSSIPVYGPYQRFKYTNWSQKFYCDAVMSIIDSNLV